MKKLLTLLGAVGLVATSSATVVSCNDVASLDGYSGSIIEKLETETIYIGDDGSPQKEEVKMENHFDTVGDLIINYGTKDNIIQTLDLDTFKEAVTSAVDSVVTPTKNEKNEIVHDYDMTVTGFDSEKVKIELNANKDSKLWRGSTTIEINIKQFDETKTSYLMNGGAN